MLAGINVQPDRNPHLTIETNWLPQAPCCFACPFGATIPEKSKSPVSVCEWMLHVNNDHRPKPGSVGGDGQYAATSGRPG